MARTALTGYVASAAGTQGTWQAPDVSNGNTVPVWCRYLLVSNVSGGGGDDEVLTITTPGTYDGLAIANRSITCPKGATDVPMLITLGQEYDNGDGTILLDWEAGSDTNLIVVPFA